MGIAVFADEMIVGNFLKCYPIGVAVDPIRAFAGKRAEPRIVQIQPIKLEAAINLMHVNMVILR